jgi:hypothetical protein
MIAFGHTSVGSLVGLAGYSYFGQTDPVLGLTLTAGAGLVSHYIADFIPHGHFFKGTEHFAQNVIPVLFFDLALSLALFTFLAFRKFGFDLPFWYVLVGIAGAQLPDVLDGLIYTKFIPKLGLIKTENNFHQATHWHGKGNKTLLLGLRDVWQLSVVLIAIFLLK